MQLVNQRTGATIASDVAIAATRASRRQGLLGRTSLDANAALILTPCCAVHSAFMKFAIDVVFVDREGTVKRVVPLAPWRVAAQIGAAAVLELAAGAACDVRVGDRVYLSDGSSGPGTRTSSFSSRSLRKTASNPACSGS